jgi:hypothetical protein
LERIIHREDKKKCGLTFKFSLDVPFSISLKEGDAEKFKFNVANSNDDVSKVLRDILFKKMGLNSKRELDIFLAKATDLSRELIYDKIGVNRLVSFSEIFEKEVLEFNKNIKNE